MAKVVNAIVATVEHVTAAKEGDFGPYRSVLFKDDAGEKIWKSFNVDAPELEVLSKGVRVQLVPAGERHGKTSHNILLLDTPNPTAVPPTPTKAPGELSPDTKRAIAQFVTEQGNLYKFCWTTAQTTLEGLASEEESVRCLASSLYINATRKFGLDR